MVVLFSNPLSAISCILIMTLMQLCHASPPSRSFEIPFLEEQSEGTEVHDLKDDLLVNEKAGVHFKMLKQDMTVGLDMVNDKTRWVTLDENSGIITVSQPVDRERDCNGEDSLPCVIHVKIARKPQRVFQIIDIKLNVIDINDHAPKFPSQPVLVVNISEALPVSTRVNIDRFLATDADTGKNAEIVYTLSRNDYFSIHTSKDPTGSPRLDLVVTDNLDHEHETSYDLRLTATDRGTPQPKFSSVTLRVGIIDTNDNPPVFSKQMYSVELQENLGPESVIATVHASDADSSNFGEIRYFIPEAGNSIVAQNLVAVDPVTGEVLLRESLDRERHNNIRVIIGARDLAGTKSKIGKTILAIQVQDENDNAPVIQISIIVDANESIAYLSEAANIGTYVAQIVADDADVDQNGEVDIGITTQILSLNLHDTGSRPSLDLSEFGEFGDYFELEEGGFIKTGRRLNRELHPGFRVTVRACDKAIKPLCSYKDLTIMLLDENDNPPVFINNVQVATLREDMALGTLVASVKATDKDSLPMYGGSAITGKGLEPSPNGMVRYELHNGAGCFNIDKVTGKIRLVGSLDYEKKKNWMLVVTAKDLGKPSLSANLTLNVKVTDVNDNAPLFSNPAVSNQTVAATIQSEDVITKINAIDYDDGIQSDVWYTIASEDGSTRLPRIFILDQFNGNLRLNMSNPDLKESLGTHTLVIKAQDLGTPPLKGYTSLRVEVYDVPVAVLPTFTKVTEEPITEAGGDLTVVLIVSLASATLLLVLVLAGVIFKCKRENKEIRTYNCKNAESKKAWELENVNQTALSGNTLMMSSNHLMTSRDSNMNSWNRSMDTQVTNDSKHIVDNISNRSSQRSLRKKVNSFKETRFHPSTATQVDGDSGRGDSDHEGITETGSYQEKVEGQPTQNVQGLQPSSIASSALNNVIAVDMPDANNLGPLCTHLCREYGHSDSCWMPSDNHVQERYYYPSGYQHSVTPSYHHPSTYASGQLPMGVLETISETQPLHSVLGEDYDHQPHQHASYQNSYGNPQVSLVSHSETGYYTNSDGSYQPSYWTNPMSPIDDVSNTTTLITSPRQCPSESQCVYAGLTSPAKCRSASDLFHDGMAATPQSANSSYCQAGVAAGVKSCYGNNSTFDSTTENSVGSANNKRRSSSSLHGDLLNRRYFAQGSVASRADDVVMSSPHLSQYGEVSMQETQQIIDDIDQLIDS